MAISKAMLEQICIWEAGKKFGSTLTGTELTGKDIKDAHGHKTYGYGSLTHPNGKYMDLIKSVWTLKELEDCFIQEVNQKTAKVEAWAAGLNLKQCLIDAIVSLCYNFGNGVLTMPSKCKGVCLLIKKNPNDPNIRSTWEHGSDSLAAKYPGLPKRRRAEAAWYYGSTSGDMSVANTDGTYSGGGDAGGGGGGTFTWSGLLDIKDTYAIHEEYDTFTGKGGNIFENNEKNAFTLLQFGDKTEKTKHIIEELHKETDTIKHTRIYSTNDSCIVLDTLSLPLSPIKDENGNITGYEEDTFANINVTLADVDKLMEEISKIEPSLKGKPIGEAKISNGGLAIVGTIDLGNAITTGGGGGGGGEGGVDGVAPGEGPNYTASLIPGGGSGEKGTCVYLYNYMVKNGVPWYVAVGICVNAASRMSAEAGFTDTTATKYGPTCWGIGVHGWQVSGYDATGDKMVKEACSNAAALIDSINKHIADKHYPHAAKMYWGPGVSTDPKLKSPVPIDIQAKYVLQAYNSGKMKKYVSEMHAAGYKDCAAATLAVNKSTNPGAKKNTIKYGVMHDRWVKHGKKVCDWLGFKYKTYDHAVAAGDKNGNVSLKTGIVDPSSITSPNLK